MSDLKPCPFCGCLASMHIDGGVWAGTSSAGKRAYRVECEGTCHSMTCYWHTEAEAIAAWNNRPVEAALEQRIYGLKRRVHFLERHNQKFDRCESGWCNPTPDCDPAMTDSFSSDSVLLNAWKALEQRIAELEAALKRLVSECDTENGLGPMVAPLERSVRDADLALRRAREGK